MLLGLLLLSLLPLAGCGQNVCLVADVPSPFDSQYRVTGAVDWKAVANERSWRYIVVHHSATATGDAAKFDRSHRDRGWDELGYHFVIGNGTDTPDGFIEAGPRWHKQKHGAHCKTPGNYYNQHGIGICLVGDFTKTEPTPRQLASLSRVVRFLTSQCRIPTRRVTTHKAITGDTACPGSNFELAALRRSLTGPATATSMP